MCPPMDWQPDSCLLTAGLASTPVTPISNKQLFTENLSQIFIKVSGRDIFRLQVYIVSNLSAVPTHYNVLRVVQTCCGQENTLLFH